MREIYLEQFLEGSNIWGRVQSLTPFPFFDDVAPEKLDAMLINRYGNKIVFSKFISKQLDSIAEEIVIMYRDKWTRIIDINNMVINIGSDSERVKTEVINQVEKRINNRDDVNKVSAFNSDELIINDGSNSKNEDDLKGDTTKTLKDTNISLRNAYNNLSLFQKANIINTVLNDVSTYLTLDIY